MEITRTLLDLQNRSTDHFPDSVTHPYRFQLAVVAFDALIKLVSAVIPQPNKCAQSLYMLCKYCLNVFPDFKSSHCYICMSCQAPLENMCEQCQYCSGKKIGRFLVADLGAQLRSLKV